MRPIPFGEERLVIAKFMLSITADLYRTIDPPRARVYGRHLDLLLVACCVTIGHIEGRPMTTTKVANLLGISRTTAMRRLADLTEQGSVVRDRTRYLLTDDHLSRVDAATMNRLAKYFHDVSSALRRI